MAVDGKTLRGAHDSGQPAPHLLSAILHQEAIVIGQIAVEAKTNEIPKLPQLLDPLPLQGAVVTADALHTQQDTALYLVETKKADYLFIAKDNQPTLRQDIAESDRSFFIIETDLQVTFQTDSQGRVASLSLRFAGTDTSASRIESGAESK